MLESEVIVMVAIFAIDFIVSLIGFVKESNCCLKIYFFLCFDTLYSIAYMGKGGGRGRYVPWVKNFFW